LLLVLLSSVSAIARAFQDMEDSNLIRIAIRIIIRILYAKTPLQ
jgi:hypothetical protein